LKEAMWEKLKSAQNEEVEKRNAMRAQVQKKVSQANVSKPQPSFNLGARLF